MVEFSDLWRGLEQSAMAEGVRFPDRPGAELIKGHQPIQLHAYDGSVGALRSLSEKTLIAFEASEIRRDRTGLHARLRIVHNRDTLVWSNLNIEKDEDRGRLSNRAHKMLDSIVRETYPADLFRHDLDDFCLHLWDCFLQEQDAVELEGNPDLPVLFHLHPYIIKGGGTIMFGPPGQGKSYTCLLMAISVDAGEDDIWDVPNPGKTLFVNLERSAESIQRRLALCNIALGYQPSRPLLTLNARGKSLRDIQDALERVVNKHGVEVVFLDSISRAGMGSLVEDRSVNAIVDVMNNLCPTWFGIAHSPRADSGHVYGSVHFEAGADIIVKLMAEKSDAALGIGLSIVKDNDVGPVPRQILRYTFGEKGLLSADRAKPGQFIHIENDNQSPEHQVKQYLLDVGASDATEIAKALNLSRTIVSGILQDSETFQKLPRRGKMQPYAVRFGDL